MRSWATGLVMKGDPMVLVITDTGLIWNKENPFLKKYKDIVLVVCLEGEKVTDEYECFVSPFEREALTADAYGINTPKFKALASVARELNNTFSYHDDIVFLTDNEPTTLYPYYALKDLVKYHKLHLVTVPPMDFEEKRKKLVYREILADMSRLDSVLYYDINRKLQEVEKGAEIQGFLKDVRDDLGNMMPRFLNGIYHMYEGPCYFDFSSMEYVLLKEGFNSIDISNREKRVTDIDFPLHRVFCTLGRAEMPSYPEEGEEIKEVIERPTPRLDGKKICNILREQRIKLAKANNIVFESEECPSIGPCAGTCDKCDAEAEFLWKEMKKIPEEKRVYPYFDPAEEVTI